MTKQISILYTTVASQTEATTLAKLAVEHKLAACVNIIPQVISIYEWHEEIEQEQECILIFKTANEKISPLKNWLKAHHSYETPAMHSFYATTSEDFYEYIARTAKFKGLVQPKKSLLDFIKIKKPKDLKNDQEI